MRRFPCTALLLALGLMVARGAEPAERFRFIAIGCMPYGKDTYPAFERLLAEINRQKPAFTVHLGDTKAGSEPPTDAYYAQVRDWLNTIDGPVIYTPGDNEWTDVNGAAAGRHDPLVWLAKVRALNFANERSLGRAPIPLVTQRRDAGFEKFVENARWSRGGVVFATLHVVGSNNNLQPQFPGAVEEYRERDAANVAWLRATFAEARTAEARGVALFFQAEPLLADAAAKASVGSGFRNFLAALEDEARAWAKPVLLVHADSHRYRHDAAVRLRRDGEPLPNVTRLETFGEKDIHAVSVLVDQNSAQVFLAGPLFIPGNDLPALPRPSPARGKGKQ